MSWLYGNTYFLPTSFIIWNEFPDMELVDLDRLTAWNATNYRRLRYQTDTKWNKGHLPAMFASYRKWVGDGSQLEKFQSLMTDDPKKNYSILFNEIKGNLHKFGRYATWFYLQTLRDCCGLNIEADSLVLEDYSGSKSHRNGLCYALNKEEWIDQGLDAEQLKYLNGEAAKIVDEIRTRYNLDAEYFGMETCLCSFKKIFRKKQGRYLGYYLDRQAEEITKVSSDNWDGINWKPLWDFRNEELDPRLSSSKWIDNKRMEVFLDTGNMEYIDWLK